MTRTQDADDHGPRDRTRTTAAKQRSIARRQARATKYTPAQEA